MLTTRRLRGLPREPYKERVADHGALDPRGPQPPPEGLLKHEKTTPAGVEGNLPTN